MTVIHNALIHRLRLFKTKTLSSIRKQRLEKCDFSIISNNCWGGSVYRRYGLEYLSPTVGLYFFAQEYIDFCLELRECLHSKLIFIRPEESKYYSALKERNQTNVPIGLLNDKIEIVFLHYKSKAEAFEKWTRRAERVNEDNIILKFSEMDLCLAEHLRIFDALPFKKICFTACHYPELSSTIPITKVVKDGRVCDDTTYYADYVHLTEFINSGRIIRGRLSQG